MSETPEAVIREALTAMWHDETPSDYQVHGKACPGEATCECPYPLEALAALRTQLQQAEQERDAEKHRADKLQKNIDSNLAAYSDWTVERKAVESQLQQAETALRAIGEERDLGRIYRLARVALAAPPPNTKDIE